MIDIHSHVLPGLDDGARDLDEAIRMCTMAAKDGISTMVASPHHLNGSYVNRREHITRAVSALNEALTSRDIELTIVPGSDLHLSSELLDELQAGTAMTLNDGGKFILLELPRFFVPSHVKEQVFRLKLSGLTPIITHPERNNVAMEDPNFLYELTVGGALLQLTAGSITGDFGSNVEARCKSLIGHAMAHIISSDAHDSRLRPPRLSKAFRAVADALGSEEARMTVIDRPASILAGKMPAINRPLRPKKRTLLSMLGLKRPRW